MTDHLPNTLATPEDLEFLVNQGFTVVPSTVGRPEFNRVFADVSKSYHIMAVREGKDGPWHWVAQAVVEIPGANPRLWSPVRYADAQLTPTAAFILAEVRGWQS